MATAATQSDPEARLALLTAPRPTNAAASAREALSRKCPRFVPSSAPVLPFLDASAQVRRYVENVPHTDDGVALTFGGKAQAQRVAA